ncbi:MAG: ABC transporter substrate-binding protein [Cyanobacteria bacterium SZAS LIN-2]|nr:ABC transporter substrate-binding protein [Cyanobacteria bacterium SZAS LIN-3]MBS1995091.1 ABC transporter substrate-binding protein [Cyanobacteria bacterium SZAS LIN-2]
MNTSSRSFIRSLQQAFAGASLLTAMALPAVAEEPQAATGSAAWSNVQRLLQSFQMDRQVKVGRSGKVNLIAASDLIDYRQIAQRSVGKAQWQTLTAAQREDLTSTIESLVQTRYYPRWRKIFGKGAVTFVSESKKGSDTIVTTNLTLGHKCEPLLWQLCGSNPKIVSLAVDKNDLLTRLKERIQAHQAKGGYAEMISWLKGKGKTDGGAGGGDAVGVADAPLKTSARTIDLID